MYRLTLIPFLALFFFTGRCAAQDTLHITMRQAETMFLQRNLSLLAQRYSIDSAQAQVIQAKLFPNPNFSYARGPVFPLHDPDASFFSNSESAATLSQLIILAGKRNKQIRIAEANVELTRYQFYDLLRTLKYTLRTNLLIVYYLQQSAAVYSKEIGALQQVVNAFNAQEGKGYISAKEVVRIKAQLYAFQSEYNDLVNQVNDAQSELRLLLLQKPVYIIPDIDTDREDALDPLRYSLPALVDSAQANRPDLRMATISADLSKLNYDYQRSLAVPDLTLNFSYDRQGSYVNDFHSVGAAIDLPFFNRNQGNIKSAKAVMASSFLNRQNAQATVEEQVFRALQKALDADRLYRKIDPSFTKEFEKLNREVMLNYQKRNLGLLDFLDFYDSYKQNTVQTNGIRLTRASALEDLNFYTGTDLFN